MEFSRINKKYFSNEQGNLTQSSIEVYDSKSWEHYEGKEAVAFSRDCKRT